MMRWLVLWLSALVLAAPAQALTPAQARALATGDTASRVAALNALVAVPDDKTVALIQALSDDAVKFTDSAVFIIKDDKGFDPVTGAEVPVPESAEDVINNNQMRTELGAALALVGLQSPDTKTRLDAVKTLASDPSEDKLPLIEKAYAAEQVPAIKEALGDLRFALLLGNADRAKRLEAAEALAESGTPATKLLLSERLKVETDAEVKAALSAALVDIDARLVWGERLGVDLHRHQPGFDPAAGGAGPGHHLRADGRDQHGPRRADDDRRLCHLRGAEPLPQLLPRGLRPLRDRGDPGVLPGCGAGRRGAGARRHPLALRPPAGNAAGHLGHQPDPDAGGAQHLRCAERAGGKPRLAVGRLRGDEQPDAALQPHRHHHLRGPGAGRRGGADRLHAARACSCAA